VIRLTTTLPALLAFAAAATAQTDAPATPLGYLIGLVGETKTASPALAALRGTEDKALTPVFEAMTRSSDKKRRLFGVVALAELVGKDSAGALRERLAQDPVMAIRAESLGRLIEMQAVAPEQIADALKVPDENVQCLAARALVARGQVNLALGALEKLAGSSDSSTAALAQSCLLGLGRREHLPSLRKVMRDPETPPVLLGALLRQIERQKITAALPLCLHVAGTEEHSMNLRVQAYKVAAAVSSLGAATLRDAIARSKRDAFRVRLLKVLASRDDAGRHLGQLADGQGAVPALARFELARKVPGPTAAKAVTAAVALEHPVVIAYLLDRADEDIKAHGKACDYYVPGFVQLIRSANPRAKRMQKEHFLAAGAASRLIELGTPAAVAGLKELLAGKADAVTRATAAGLLRARNAAAGELVRPLLASPYAELSTDAALALGHFGDPAARPRLAEILANRQRHPPALVVLASWYLVKIAGQSRPAAAQLAKAVK